MDRARDSAGNDDLALVVHRWASWSWAERVGAQCGEPLVVLRLIDLWRKVDQRYSTLPSTLMAWLVTLRAPGEHKKSAMAAMSSTVTIRRSDILFRYSWRMVSKSTPTVLARAAITLSIRAPSTMPGRIAFTRMSLGPNSIAKDLTMPTMAHLVAA